MTALLEILSPSFLLRDALLGSVLVGLVCPLVGVYFVLRRMIFLGVALPQISSAGIAFSFLVYRSLIGAHEHGNASERLLATIGSLVFTLGGLAILSALERRRENVEARIGVAYAIASAATILFLAADPWGETHMVSLLKGDILATTGTSLVWMSGTFAVIVFVLFVFRREFLLVSFDRDLATVFGWRVGLWDLLLYLTIGTTISLGVMVAGPLVTFGFLVLPTLAARLLTRAMIAFSLVASAIGFLAAFFGFYCAYRFDLPLGPAEVALAFLPLAVLGMVSGARRLLTPRSLILALGLVVVCGCSKPFTAPPRSVTTVAVLPPSNRTGDPLLVAGGSFLEQYAFKTERVTVPEALLAETRSYLEKRGYSVLSGETVASATGGQAPQSVADAARIAAQLGGANVLYIEIRRWDAVDQSTPRAIIVSIAASLVEPGGRVVWQADRPAKPVPTEGAISQGTAFMIAVQKIVDQLFGSWGAT